MTDASVNISAVPRFIARRAWWWLPLGLWAVAVLASLMLQFEQQRQHGMEVATEGLRNMFRMVVLMRSWNAAHGGIYVPVTEKTQPNAYLVHPRRDLVTQDGQRLTLVNPAFMTRQLAEMANISEGAIFHITSLKPIRPRNAADTWESAALRSFEQGVSEQVAVVQVNDRQQLRYMAPLTVKPPCMSCHALQGYKVGDIRGGISVSLPYAPIQAAIVPARRQAVLSHGLVFVLVGALGWLLLELLRRRWHDLEANLRALQRAHGQLEDSKRSIEQARDAAEAASLSKSAFLSTMSHELRTPMNGVLGMAELLRETELSAEQRDYLDTLMKSGEGLMHLLNDVIEYSRLDTGEVADTVKTAFSPERVRNSVMTHLARPAQAKGLSLHAGKTEVPAGLLLGDAERIAMILKRLGENAIKFTDHGEVDFGIESRRDDAGHVILSYTVRDTGVGMTPDMLARLFKPFEIADSSTTRRHSGIGLGLATCKRLADSLGGRLKVISSPGSGSLFTLELSLDPATETWVSLDATALAHFEALLAQDDIAASDAFAELAPALQAHLGERFVQLEDQMAGFQFAEALATLRENSGTGTSDPSA